MIRPATLALVGAALLLGGCGSAERGEPFAPPVQPVSIEARTGEQVFMVHCHQCHPRGTAGLGPPLNNVPLPAFLVRYQVRHGLGAMPAFGVVRLSDEELDQLIAYLLELRGAS